MHADETAVAILFADICDSTPLYEEHGDGRALAIIAARLDDLARIAAATGGEVIRSKGDDVLCTFEVPARALDAAAAMVNAHGHGIAAIRVGIHRGPVIRARADVFGDAVNVAARMLSLAKPGEAVASADLVEHLDPLDSERVRLIGRRELKGKLEPVDVYSMVRDEGEATQRFWAPGYDPRAGGVPTVTVSATLVLEHDGETREVGDGERCLIGRAERCDLRVDSRSVSREHARVDVRAGRVTITDRSSTGTWVLEGDGAHTTLRRDSARITGRGRIRLGRHPRDPGPATEIAFEVRRGE